VRRAGDGIAAYPCRIRRCGNITLKNISSQ
jgi:hypothetical protein